MDSLTITTDRIVMRPHGVGDFDDLCAMWGDPAVVRLLGGRTQTPEEVWQRLHRYAGGWALMGWGYWAARDATSGAYLGDIGFLDGKRTGVEGFGGDPEIGWALVPAAQGRGLATEAVRAVLGWGAGRFARTVAMIDPRNDASLRVATRCGFSPFAASRYKDAPTTLWEYRWPRTPD